MLLSTSVQIPRYRLGYSSCGSQLQSRYLDIRLGYSVCDCQLQSRYSACDCQLQSRYLGPDCQHTASALITKSNKSCMQKKKEQNFRLVSLIENLICWFIMLFTSENIDLTSIRNIFIMCHQTCYNLKVLTKFNIITSF